MVWGFVNAAGGLVEGLDTEVSSLIICALLQSWLANKLSFMRQSRQHLPICLSVMGLSS